MMKTEHRVLALSITLALAVWLTDALLHALFAHSSLPGTWDPTSPQHDILIRSFASGYVLLFGLLISRSISQRRTAEEALRDSERRYRELAESIGDVFFAVDRSLGCTYWNKATEQLTGVSAPEAIGGLVSGLLPEAMGIGIVRACQETLTRGQPQTLVLDQPNGATEPWYEIHVYPSLQGLSVFARDITDRKRAEQEREELIRQLQGALAHVKTLKGLLPICANCKRIRDDQGYWRTVEAYVREHSEAEFTHGLCPDCARQLYSDYAEGASSLGRAPSSA
jgi:PAS domain S-box-containing protein